MELTKIDKDLLKQIADLHSVPQGAFNIRKNGQGLARSSSANIDIIPKKDKPGIDIVIKPNTINESVHIPVIITSGGIDDLVYNDFYIGDNSVVTIVAGCGIHNASDKKSSHNGIHTFKIGKNCKVTYIEKHLGIGNGAPKDLSPTTILNVGENSTFEMETVQIKGVNFAERKTTAYLANNAHIVVKEKIKTEEKQKATTSFLINLDGAGSSAKVVSRSVAMDSSFQQFNSNLVGNNACFGHVECDGLICDNSRIVSIPQIDAKNSNAELIHEAQIGKIAGEQLIKLMTRGLTQKQAEEAIIKAYLK